VSFSCLAGESGRKRKALRKPQGFFLRDIKNE